MIRTVPATGSEDINLYMRTYYSLLRTTDAIKIQSLVEVHGTIDSSLHVHARDKTIDISALVYSTLRLPFEIIYVKHIILGQLVEDFSRVGHTNVEAWQRVHAPGRRRRTHWNSEDILAVMIASRSDIDDMIPILTSLQIEWNKIHEAFARNPSALKLLKSVADTQNPNTTNTLLALAEKLALDVADLSRLQSAWKANFIYYIQAMADHKLDLSLQLLAGSQINYRKASARWWDHLNQSTESRGLHLRQRAIYFVSSNTHSIANLVSGYASESKASLLKFMQGLNQADLLSEWESLQDELSRTAHHNFYYYLLKKYQSVQADSIKAMYDAEKAVGFHRVVAEHGFDVEAQIFELRQFDPDKIDGRVTQGLDTKNLKNSDALIINIDYPLGLRLLTCYRRWLRAPIKFWVCTLWAKLQR